MDLNSYRAFTQDLVDSLRPREEVIGLVALGSMAEREVVPDAYSDHDFWVIVQTGAQNAFRETFDWLPGASDIAWGFRETEHGVKILYRSGHLLEYAVFDLEELHVARLNRFRILLDKGELRQRLEELVLQSRLQSESRGESYFAGQFLTSLLVGIGRYRRGECLSAHKFIKHDAVQNLLTLLSRRASPVEGTVPDDLDPARRFEVGYPDLGERLGSLMGAPLLEAAEELLTLFIETMGPEAVGVPGQVYEIVHHAVSRPGRIKNGA